MKKDVSFFPRPCQARTISREIWPSQYRQTRPNSTALPPLHCSLLVQQNAKIGAGERDFSEPQRWRSGGRNIERRRGSIPPPSLLSFLSLKRSLSIFRRLHPSPASILGGGSSPPTPLSKIREAIHRAAEVALGAKTRQFCKDCEGTYIVQNAEPRVTLQQIVQA